MKTMSHKETPDESAVKNMFLQAWFENEIRTF